MWGAVLRLHRVLDGPGPPNKGLIQWYKQPELGTVNKKFKGLPTYKNVIKALTKQRNDKIKMSLINNNNNNNNEIDQ